MTSKEMDMGSHMQEQTSELQAIVPYRRINRSHQQAWLAMCTLDLHA